MNETPKAAKPPHVRVRRGNAEDAARIRDALLQAALDIFVDGGHHAITMRAVAIRVGVSAMTAYRYFADKEALLNCMWQHILERALIQMKAAYVDEKEPRARMRREVSAFIDYWEGHPEEYRLLYMTEHLPVDRSAHLKSTPVYEAFLAEALDASRALARAIGAPVENAQVASDVRFMMAIGYLQSMMVNHRYPWSDAKSLKGIYIENVIATSERCLWGPERSS